MVDALGLVNTCSYKQAVVRKQDTIKLVVKGYAVPSCSDVAGPQKFAYQRT